MKIRKLKIVNVLSDGSTNFSYKTLHNSKFYTFFEKDYANFCLNLKKNAVIINNKGDKQLYNYKHKYVA
jgi:hypothetical protein